MERGPKPLHKRLIIHYQTSARVRICRHWADPLQADVMLFPISPTIPLAGNSTQTHAHTYTHTCPLTLSRACINSIEMDGWEVLENFLRVSRGCAGCGVFPTIRSAGYRTVEQFVEMSFLLSEKIGTLLQGPVPVGPCTACMISLPCLANRSARTVVSAAVWQCVEQHGDAVKRTAEARATRGQRIMPRIRVLAWWRARVVHGVEP